MALNIINTSGGTVAVVPDRAVDRTSTSLALVGFNATGYGKDHLENFIRLMENFANDRPPENPLLGQFWFNTLTNRIMIFKNNVWSDLNADTNDTVEGGLSGTYSVPIEDTSVTAILAGGDIVAVIARDDIPQVFLPDVVQISGEEMDFRPLFYNGIQAGINLADSSVGSDNEDRVFNGRVPVAEQAHFAGGGSADDLASGWGFIELGNGKSIGLMVSSGSIVAATSSTHVLASELPLTVTFNIRKERDSDRDGNYDAEEEEYNTVTCSLRARFPARTMRKWVLTPQGLPAFDASENISDVAISAGFTLASSLRSSGTINDTVYEMALAILANQTAAIAAIEANIHAWVDSSSAPLNKISQLENLIMDATSTPTIQLAIQAIVAGGGGGGGGGDASAAIAALKSEFNSALGTPTFVAALNILAATVTKANTNETNIAATHQAFVTRFGGSTFNEALVNLHTLASNGSGNGGAVMTGYSLSRNSDGFMAGVDALAGNDAVSMIKFSADNFHIGNANASIIPFDVVDDRVYMRNDLIEDNSLGADKIAVGLTSALKFTAPNTTSLSSFETTIIETPEFSVGDATHGAAVAMISYYQDGRYLRDSGQDIRVYIDIGDGNGYSLVKYHQQQGILVSGAQVTFGIPVLLPVSFESTHPCKIKVTATAIRMPSQVNLNSSGCLNTEIHVFTSAR